METNYSKLDNPVWCSLHETHQEYSIRYGDMIFYHPDYCPFGAFMEGADTMHSIDQYAQLVTNFYVVGEKPAYSNYLRLNKNLVCNQMVLDHKIKVIPHEDIVELNQQYQEDLTNLVNLVQPGYFKKNTSQLGNYFGIYQNETLVAVTGERMKMNDLTEVSAVVTHPAHTGKGYAKQLVAHTANRVFNENKIPFLHVAESNTTAINLYENLGFKTRRKISFWNLVRI